MQYKHGFHTLCAGRVRGYFGGSPPGSRGRVVPRGGLTPHGPPSHPGDSTVSKDTSAKATETAEPLAPGDPAEFAEPAVTDPAAAAVLDAAPEPTPEPGAAAPAAPPPEDYSKAVLGALKTLDRVLSFALHSANTPDAELREFGAIITPSLETLGPRIPRAVWVVIAAAAFAAFVVGKFTQAAASREPAVEAAPGPNGAEPRGDRKSRLGLEPIYPKGSGG